MHKVARHLDPTRYTTCAQLTMCPVNSPLNHITDIIGYNHYYGWYMGSCDEINNWLDEWHRENPEGKLCLSDTARRASRNTTPTPLFRATTARTIRLSTMSTISRR